MKKNNIHTLNLRRSLLASAVIAGMGATSVQAIEIDGESYWDGGYSGNPALFPLFGYEGSSVEKGGYLARGYNDLDWL